ncbi:hypothetical protein H8K32_15345 [Undibacterium jejuense]|uniref:Uncharacterized protein n=1 Tax=Undibacterium jejuense TaxID=1344949 RepID=A0A923HM76_9BURK|nr:hypothetical protein [Undibacterium jejuense]MBC3863479.1 hypothetical protein [Undibacterium jejuense]
MTVHLLSTRYQQRTTNGRIATGVLISVSIQVIAWYLLVSPQLRLQGEIHRPSLQPLILQIISTAPPQQHTTTVSQQRIHPEKKLLPTHTKTSSETATKISETSSSSQTMPTVQQAEILDLETLKEAVRTHPFEYREKEAQRESKRETVTSDTVSRSIEKAARPKCDKDYTPQLGGVKFQNLLKIPFLMKGAVSDSGCKW